MELIGKGGFEKGTLHVALRVPDGHIAAHANQARITRFLPCDDPSTCNAAPDVVSFAIKYARRAHPSSTQHTYSRRHVFTPQRVDCSHPNVDCSRPNVDCSRPNVRTVRARAPTCRRRGYWKGAVDDPAFSFSDIYDPVTFSGARFCEARVWSIFNHVADKSSFNASKYIDYAKGWVSPHAAHSHAPLHRALHPPSVLM